MRHTPPPPEPRDRRPPDRRPSGVTRPAEHGKLVAFLWQTRSGVQPVILAVRHRLD